MGKCVRVRVSEGVGVRAGGSGWASAWVSVSVSGLLEVSESESHKRESVSEAMGLEAVELALHRRHVHDVAVGPPGLQEHRLEPRVEHKRRHRVDRKHLYQLPGERRSVVVRGA